MLLRVFLVWFLLVVLAVLNGGFRTAVLNPRVGEQAGHLASTIILCGVIVAVTWITIRWIAPATVGAALLVGGVWVLPTVGFEFLAGHYLFGNSWERLTADYNLVRGRVWLAVLVATEVAPWGAARVRGLV